MSNLLAIDPGPLESAWVVIDTNTRRPRSFAKEPNLTIRDSLAGHTDTWRMNADRYVIEMVASYGMPVGKEVFETVLWIGRFVEVATRDEEPDLVYRRDVKMHHNHSARGTDATIRQALVDRFASGERNHGKGTKNQPGFFYGFHSDIWSAYALAVYAADTLHPMEPALDTAIPYTPGQTSIEDHLEATP